MADGDDEGHDDVLFVSGRWGWTLLYVCWWVASGVALLTVSLWGLAFLVPAALMVIYGIAGRRSEVRIDGDGTVTVRRAFARWWKPARTVMLLAGSYYVDENVAIVNGRLIETVRLEGVMPRRVVGLRSTTFSGRDWQALVPALRVGRRERPSFDDWQHTVRGWRFVGRPGSPTP